MRVLTASEHLPESWDQPPVTPWFRAGMVCSLDGVIAVDGDSSALSGPADRAIYRNLRSQSDAVVVGATTGRHPGYVRLERPLVIVSNTGLIDSTAQHPIVVTTAAGAPAARESLPGASIILAGEDQVDLRLAHTRLLERGLQHLICEGGPTLLYALLRADLIDELCLTISPLLIGTGPRLIPDTVPTRLRLRAAAESENALFLRYLVEPAASERGRMER